MSKPITEIRAVTYIWTEDTSPGPYPDISWRLEFRREDDEEWEEVPLIHVNGKPPALKGIK